MSTGVFRGAALGVILLGFVLGSIVAEPEHPFYMGFLWAVATAFGAVIGGAVLTLLVMGLVLNRGKEEGVDREEAGVRLLMSFMLLSAGVTWILFWAVLKP